MQFIIIFSVFQQFLNDLLSPTMDETKGQPTAMVIKIACLLFSGPILMYRAFKQSGPRSLRGITKSEFSVAFFFQSSHCLCQDSGMSTWCQEDFRAEKVNPEQIIVNSVDVEFDEPIPPTEEGETSSEIIPSRAISSAPCSSREVITISIATPACNCEYTMVACALVSNHATIQMQLKKAFYNANPLKNPARKSWIMPKIPINQIQLKEVMIPN
ncbi:hypothetical protein P5673_032754 [Acropora cervicornis]|uniref:Uncharacterized protein n=1 Tax=Acropora cervicornis TaxID=6130 RepID=A0AAD9PQW4_ACRCE|nr:hypothetical protein P5673_032754 [Acropora cervicornis]